MQRINCVLVVLATPLVLAAGGDVGKELKALQGTWKAVALEAGGKPLPKEAVPDFLFIVGADGKSTGQMGKVSYQAKVSVDARRTPSPLTTRTRPAPTRARSSSASTSWKGTSGPSA
jgi:uncharacterized protein (TIGR03067 family)